MWKQKKFRAQIKYSSPWGGVCAHERSREDYCINGYKYIWGAKQNKNRGWFAWIMVRPEKSKMAAIMVANYMEKEYIHKISCYNMLLVWFWTQNVKIEEDG